MKILSSVIALMFILFSSPSMAVDPAAKRVEMKLNYAETVIMKSKSAERVRQSDNEEAKGMLKEAEANYEKARQALEDEEFAEAENLANEALKTVTIAAQKVPNKEEKLKADRARYEELYQQVLSYKSWNTENPELVKDANLDMDAIMAEVDTAHKESQDDNYDAANKRLETLLNDIVSKTNKAIGDKTIAYTLNFETPEEEFEYELKRNDEYARLLVVAIEQKDPSAGIRMLMGKFEEKALGFRGEADKMAEDEEFADAVTKLQESTEEYLKALKIAGVR